MTNWQEFDKSTFTFVGRNTEIIKWAVENDGKPAPKTIFLTGSGAIEPFIIASLPGLGNTQVVGIEINPELLTLGEDLKAGKPISWDKIAEHSLNPGRPNTDLADQKRLKVRIDALGNQTISNLGSGFNIEQMQVAPPVGQRVSFINADAVTFFQDITEAEMIGDFFLQVNLNKSKDAETGVNYTRRLVMASLQALSSNGSYLLGDTSRNLPVSIEHAAHAYSYGVGRLNLAGLVHAVNLDGLGFIASHYLVMGRGEANAKKEMKTSTKENLAKNPKTREIELLETTTGLWALSARLKTDEINLAIIGDITINADRDETLAKLVPQPGNEFSSRIVFPAQKAEMDVTPTS